VRRSLIHYWRIHLGFLLGTAIASTALTGALLVGDSMRGSLRDLALERLGRIDHVLVSERFFRSDLAEGLPGTNADAISLSGAARHTTTQARASRVQIQGIDSDFAQLFPRDGAALLADLVPADNQPFPSLVISASLQRELGAAIGDPILLSLERQSQVHRESLFGHRATDDIVATLRVVLKGVLPDNGAGRFGLKPNQHLPLNAYLDLQTLQHALDQQGQINTLLVAAPHNSRDDLQTVLGQNLDLADLGLRLTLHEEFIDLLSTRFILNTPTIAAAIQSAAAQGLKTTALLTYLANSITANDRAVPYSTVSALDDPTGLYLVDGTPAPALADDELYLDSWTARELDVKPGATIALSYYVFGPREALQTTQTEFRLAGIVRMDGLAIDRSLTPEYPGLQDEDDISAWNAPFPIDMSKIRPQDEAYWDQYGAAPKAFVAASAGRRLWRTRHGDLTALRFYTPESDDLAHHYQTLRQALRRTLAPESVGLAFRPVRQEAIQAASGATDFSGLFIGFSLFLIAAAALLVVLLCKLGLEERSREAGLLLATGYSLTAIRRRFFGEGVALVGLGALLGLGGAQFYAYLLLVGLRTWWLQAIGTPFLQLHSTWSSPILGFIATLVLVSFTIWHTVRRFHKTPIPSLLAGLTHTGTQTQRTRAPALAVFGLVMALALSLTASAVEASTAAALFFASGSAALLALLALFRIWLRSGQHHSSGSNLRIGIGNSARNPGRSVLCTALVACATFVIVAVGANRRVEQQGDPGAGGFPLLAEAEIPLHQDLNSKSGRFELGLSANLDSARFFPMRVLPGEDISCLNLYQPQTPRVLGAPSDFLHRGGFSFQQTLEPNAAEKENPWLLLQRDLGPDVVPAIGDFNSTQWILHKNLGEDVVIEDGNGKPLALRLVGLLHGSLFQGEVLIAEDRFAAHFPERSGYGYFLIETESPAPLAASLEKDLAAYGLDVTPSTERLHAYRAIENTYLSTFQTLGGLGLLLGTLGLGILLLRNVFERSGELATLSACGFSRARLSTLLLYENGFLLLTGLSIGTGAALIAVAPRFYDPGPLPWVSLCISLGLVLAAGLLASTLALELALRRPLLQTLKAD